MHQIYLHRQTDSTKDQIDVIKQRCGVTSDARMFDDTICVPSEFAGVHFEKAYREL